MIAFKIINEPNNSPKCEILEDESKAVEDDFIIRFPYFNSGIDLTRISPDDYTLYEFHIPDFSEGDYKLIKIENVLKGFFLPSKSIDYQYTVDQFDQLSESITTHLSKQNDLNQVRMFIIMYYKLIEMNIFDLIKQNELSSEPLDTLSSLLDQKLSLNKSYMILSNDIDVNDYIICLYNNGIYSNKPTFTYPRYIPYENLILNLSSDIIIKSKFILSSFQTYLISTDDAVSFFFYQYQIIEFLMEKTFSKDIDNIINSLSIMKSDYTKSTFDLKKELENHMSEKSRLQKLIRDARINISSPILLEQCNALLKKNNKKEEEDNISALYSVRNLIFHSFHIFVDNSTSNLETINEEVNKLLMNLLLSNYLFR